MSDTEMTAGLMPGAGEGTKWLCQISSSWLSRWLLGAEAALEAKNKNLGGVHGGACVCDFNLLITAIVKLPGVVIDKFESGERDLVHFLERNFKEGNILHRSQYLKASAH